ncbi:hypothetical protein SCHPADRAFT_947400 [Schizopora paradoxa]|uniref:Uncharacterized protein n=1 Tax=Schizopora paradoxa TaxID=27342 RepID=A0A0H2QZJ3_9AGAM|nr:hypothetical protein SCHPADRAFT_947400 [Schizopora paradoxa]
MAYFPPPDSKQFALDPSSRDVQASIALLDHPSFHSYRPSDHIVTTYDLESCAAGMALNQGVFGSPTYKNEPIAVDQRCVFSERQLEELGMPKPPFLPYVYGDFCEHLDDFATKEDALAYIDSYQDNIRQSYSWSAEVHKRIQRGLVSERAWCPIPSADTASHYRAKTGREPDLDSEGYPYDDEPYADSNDDVPLYVDLHFRLDKSGEPVIYLSQTNKLPEVREHRDENKVRYNSPASEYRQLTIDALQEQSILDTHNDHLEENKRCVEELVNHGVAQKASSFDSQSFGTLLIHRIQEELGAGLTGASITTIYGPYHYSDSELASTPPRSPSVAAVSTGPPSLIDSPVSYGPAPFNGRFEVTPADQHAVSTDMSCPCIAHSSRPFRLVVENPDSDDDESVYSGFENLPPGFLTRASAPLVTAYGVRVQRDEPVEGTSATNDTDMAEVTVDPADSTRENGDEAPQEDGSDGSYVPWTTSDVVEHLRAHGARIIYRGASLGTIGSWEWLPENRSPPAQPVDTNNDSDIEEIMLEYVEFPEDGPTTTAENVVREDSLAPAQDLALVRAPTRRDYFEPGIIALNPGDVAGPSTHGGPRVQFASALRAQNAEDEISVYHAVQYELPEDGTRHQVPDEAIAYLREMQRQVNAMFQH